MTISTLAEMDDVMRQSIIRTISMGVLGGSVTQAESLWGSTSAGNTTTGRVPTSATSGFDSLQDWGSNTGYLSSVDYISHPGSPTGYLTQPITLWLFDRLFDVGAFTGSSGTVTLSSQPSFLSRLPNGATDYHGLRLFFEQTAVIAGSPTAQITYTNAAGVTGRISQVSPAAGFGIPVVFPIGLQAGDTGVQKIESVICAGGGSTSFNIILARQLWMGAVDPANRANTYKRHGIDLLGLPKVYPTTAFWLVGRREINANPSVEIIWEVASK